jgi:hypothetical protein
MPWPKQRQEDGGTRTSHSKRGILPPMQGFIQRALQIGSCSKELTCALPLYHR